MTGSAAMFLMLLFSIRPIRSSIDRQQVRFGFDALPRLARLHPSVGDQVAAETGDSLEALARASRGRIDQMLTEEVPIGPLVFFPGETEAAQSSLQRVVGRHRTDGGSGHGASPNRGILPTACDPAATSARRCCKA